MENSLFASSFAPTQPNSAIPSQTLCPGTTPLILLPVRLETRFFTLPGNVTELRIRVYPDKIHIDTHHRELTTDERIGGTQYWQQEWLAGNDTTARQNAWAVLAGRCGAARAAWIARVLQPTNIQQRPDKPVPSGQSPAFAPLFPTLPAVGVNGENSWRNAPVAQLLPDRWTAIVHSNRAAALSVTGNLIKRQLPVGPNPNAAAPDKPTQDAILAGDQLALDPGMLWMVDFDTAEREGMGLRMTIPAAMLNKLDSLVVLGVASSLSPAETATQFADLLDAHHYTDGLEFLRFGTPTNNTDDRRAGYTSEDPGCVRSFNNEVLADPAKAANALRVGKALGLSPARIAATLGHIGQASQDHELDLRSMNTALWQVGWGYFLSNMMGAETGITTSAIDWARSHFLNYVRSLGPFPSLRCGSQPYGILPITALEPWVADSNDTTAAREDWLKKLLHSLRENVWRLAVDKAARIGLRTTDPDADLADVMRTDGVAHSQRIRAVLGRQYVEHLHSFNAQNSNFNSLVQTQDTVAARLLQAAGLSQLPARPRQAHGFLQDATWGLTAPLVQAGEVSPWRMLEPNYIATLLATRSIQELIDARPNPAATDRMTSLLQMLLRHALLREIATAAARLGTPSGRDPLLLLRDLELVDLVDLPPQNFILQTPPQVLHWRRLLDGPVLGAPGTIRQLIEGLTHYTAPNVQALGEFRDSLARLQTLDSEALQYLMQGTLDLSAHRLDAWITSFATKRLTAMTSNVVAGPYIGGYGWVENLRVATTVPVPVPAASMPPGEQAPLYAQPKDTGFIHAPSLTHASTAALLRNAHLGPTGIPERNAPFAIDLSSRRVREASQLLDGIRQGQPLGALLGYRLERRLHDLQFDRFIAPLRNEAPIAVRQREINNKPAETLAANNVLDGLILDQRWTSSSDKKAYLKTVLKDVTPAATDADIATLNDELSALRDMVDGLGDALTAEAAYQMARGNTTRLASTLSAIAQGNAAPPELEVAQIPRSANSLTHRVLTLFNGIPNSGPGWASYNSTPRGTSERWLSAWVRLLMGNSSRIRCTVERLDDTSGAVLESVVFALTEVPVTVLDFIYFVGSDVPSSKQSAALCYAEQMVIYQSRRRAGGFTAQASLRLQHVRPGNLAAGEITLFDALENARAIRRLLEGARGLLPADVCPPERSSAATLDLADFENRVIRLENVLNLHNKTLGTLVKQGTAALPEDLRTLLLNLSLLGLGQAVPCIAVGDDPTIRAALLRQVTALQKETASRLDQCLALRARGVAADPRARIDQLIERGRMACGKDFLMLPYFTCDAASATELTNALAASTAQQGNDALAVHGWFTRTARVRDTLGRLATCLRSAEALGTDTRLNMSVAQLPFDAKEAWVGLPPPAGKELAKSKLSMVVQTTLAINATQQLSGLLFDEWVEVIPNKEETTALTFQFDPPNSFPPQTLLVAVPPVLGQDWTTESLRSVLMETLDLAKLRAVDTSLLGAAAQYLPALYVPFNAADDAVSTDFAPLTAFTPPAVASSNGLTVTIDVPVMNATLGRTVQIAGSMAKINGTLGSVQIQFGVGGPTVQATVANFAWSWSGTIPNVIRPGQPFQIIVTANGTLLPTTVVSGTGVVNVELENIAPVITVNPTVSPLVATQLPLATTLDGLVSEGSDGSYPTPQIRYRIGAGPLTPLTLNQGRWSVPLSLPVGDTVITLQASDAFGSVTSFQKTLTVVQ